MELRQSVQSQDMFDPNELNLLGTENEIIFLITKVGCKSCIETKQLLYDNNIEYLEIDYEKLPKTFLMKLYQMRKQKKLDKFNLPIMMITEDSYFWTF